LGAIRIILWILIRYPGLSAFIMRYGINRTSVVLDREVPELFWVEV